VFTAFPDMRAEIHDQVAEGDKVVTRKTFYGTQQGEFMGIPPTGKKVAFDVIDIFRIADGRILEHWFAGDMLGLMQQLGAVPAPG
jgi:predicted ester cyclase